MQDELVVINVKHASRINRLAAFLVGLSPVQAEILLEALESTAAALVEFYIPHEENGGNINDEHVRGSAI